MSEDMSPAAQEAAKIRLAIYLARIAEAQRPRSTTPQAPMLKPFTIQQGGLRAFAKELQEHKDNWKGINREQDLPHNERG